MIKKFLITLCLSFGLFFISCSNDTNDTTTSKTNEAASEKTEDKSDVTEKVNDTVGADTTNESQKNVLAEETNNTIALIVYGANYDTYSPEILSKIKINDNSPLKDKLSSLCNELSIKKFEGLPITVSKLEKVDGKVKATINLEDDNTKSDKTFGGNYFQGSSGGKCTTVALKETFLQKSYNGEWIDSVEFLYKGKKIESQHVEELGDIIYR